MRVLVTGGAGFVGSHVCVALRDAGHDAVILDNFSNAKPDVPDRIAQITGDEVEVHKADVRDAETLDALFASSPFDAVIHCAARKAVGESVAQPLRYYDHNVVGTIRLLEAMDRYGVRRIVFSSSATVYGEPDRVPVTEQDEATRATNPYGWTKVMMEQVMRDLYHASDDWSIALLRYFNPVGAHPSGVIGEDPEDEPNNLMPYIAQVAAGRREKLSVFGNDYPTIDGTGVRDYVHVADLAEGHVVTLEAMDPEGGLLIYNLGTGKGTSVLQMVAAFEAVTDLQIPYEVVGRRPGDVAETWASVEKARRDLGWTARRGIEDMCADMWRWQRSDYAG